jgi:hypothetical protein
LPRFCLIPSGVSVTRLRVSSGRSQAPWACPPWRARHKLAQRGNAGNTTHKTAERHKPARRDGQTAQRALRLACVAPRKEELCYKLWSCPLGADGLFTNTGTSDLSGCRSFSPRERRPKKNAINSRQRSTPNSSLYDARGEGHMRRLAWGSSLTYSCPPWGASPDIPSEPCVFFSP